VCAASHGSSSSSTSALRSFRLLRVLKLAKSVPSLRALVRTVVASLPHVAYMTLLLALFVFMFAVLGVQCESVAVCHRGSSLSTCRYRLQRPCTSAVTTRTRL
jgi:hypothetical protein